MRPGHNEFVVRIGRVQGIEITLMDGEAKVPWPNLAHARLEHTATKSGVAYWSGHRVASKEPGEHTLTIDRVDGFAPIPPRKIVVEPGRWTPVVIALERVQ